MSPIWLTVNGWQFTDTKSITYPFLSTVNRWLLTNLVPGVGLEPTRAFGPMDFKSILSANSNTPAHLVHSQQLTVHSIIKKTMSFTYLLSTINCWLSWRRRWELHPCITVLQTAPFLLGYVAIKWALELRPSQTDVTQSSLIHIYEGANLTLDILSKKRKYTGLINVVYDKMSRVSSGK